MRKDKFIKITKVCTIISTVVTLIFGVGDIALKYMLNINKEAIGIIGGADGPTAVFTSSSISQFTLIAFFGILTVIGLVLQVVLKKNNN